MRHLRFTLVVSMLVVLIIGLGRNVMSGPVAPKLEVRLAENEPGVGLTEATVQSSGKKVYLHGETVVSDPDVVQARVVQGNVASSFNVAIVFTPSGSEKMAKATEAHLNRPLAILIDGKVIAAPTIRSRVTDSAVINGDFTKEQADAIAAGLNSR